MYIYIYILWFIYNCYRVIIYVYIYIYIVVYQRGGLWIGHYSLRIRKFINGSVNIITYRHISVYVFRYTFTIYIYDEYVSIYIYINNCGECFSMYIYDIYNINVL